MIASSGWGDVRYKNIYASIDNVIRMDLCFFFSLADLEASRDQLLLELHKQKVKADPSDTKHENDAKVCR